jgi:hypothetical protein
VFAEVRTHYTLQVRQVGAFSAFEHEGHEKVKVRGLLSPPLGGATDNLTSLPNSLGNSGSSTWGKQAMSSASSTKSLAEGEGVELKFARKGFEL